MTTQKETDTTIDKLKKSVVKFNEKMQSRKYRLAVLVFITMVGLYNVVAWFFKAFGMISDDTLFKLLDRSAGTLEVLIVSYIAGNVAGKVTEIIIDRIAKKLGV